MWKARIHIARFSLLFRYSKYFILLPKLIKKTQDYKFFRIRGIVLCCVLYNCKRNALTQSCKDTEERRELYICMPILYL